MNSLFKDVQSSDGCNDTYSQHFTTLGLSKNPTGWHFHQLRFSAATPSAGGHLWRPVRVRSAYRRRPRRPHFLRVQSVGIGVTSWRQEKVGSDLLPLVGLKMGYIFHMKMGHFPMKMSKMSIFIGKIWENECSPSDCPVFLDVPGLHFGKRMPHCITWPMSKQPHKTSSRVVFTTHCTIIGSKGLIAQRFKTSNQAIENGHSGFTHW